MLSAAFFKGGSMLFLGTQLPVKMVLPPFRKGIYSPTEANSFLLENTTLSKRIWCA